MSAGARHLLFFLCSPCGDFAREKKSTTHFTLAAAKIETAAAAARNQR
jgi:hypothetical protein